MLLGHEKGSEELCRRTRRGLIFVIKEPEWVVDEADDEPQKIFIGRIPIMLRSTYCSLDQLSDAELYANGECPFDQVILKSSEARSCRKK
jgi:RNA polymerase beta subunit